MQFPEGLEDSPLIVKNKHNAGLKSLNFQFLADGGGFKLKKKTMIFFFQFFFHTIKFPWFPYWKTSLTLFFFQTLV